VLIKIDEEGVMSVSENVSNFCSECRNGCKFGKDRVYCNKDGHFHPSKDGKCCNYFEPKGGNYEDSRVSY